VATGLLPPQTLLTGRYLILQKVGQGGMGAVYKAADTRISGKTWAIKELSEAALVDPQERQQALHAFRQEAEMLARLEHPNLPKVVDCFEDNGRQYLVMDYVDGETLEHTLGRELGPLPESRVVDWALQLCDVLAYLHAQQPPIIFRDLKPDNIMLDKAGKIKLIDFGIARFFKAGKSKDTIAIGTRGYAAPEQYGKAQTDVRSDIFALGATLHHLLTGYDPATNPLQFPPIRLLNPRVSTTLEAVIARALAIDPGARWQTVTEIRQALSGPSVPRPLVPPTPLAPPPTAIVKPVSQVPTGPVLTTSRGQTLVLASWPRRVGAYVIDTVLTVILLILVMIPFVILSALVADPVAAAKQTVPAWITALMLLAWLALAILYWVWPIAYWGQTPGKGVLGLQVVTREGRVPSFGRALWRAILVGIALSTIQWLIGLADFAWPLWDAQRQALHDKLAGTYVVLKDS